MGDTAQLVQTNGSTQPAPEKASIEKVYRNFSTQTDKEKDTGTEKDTEKDTGTEKVYLTAKTRTFFLEKVESKCCCCCCCCCSPPATPLTKDTALRWLDYNLVLRVNYDGPDVLFQVSPQVPDCACFVQTRVDMAFSVEGTPPQKAKASVNDRFVRTRTETFRVTGGMKGLTPSVMGSAEVKNEEKKSVPSFEVFAKDYEGARVFSVPLDKSAPGPRQEVYRSEWIKLRRFEDEREFGVGNAELSTWMVFKVHYRWKHWPTFLPSIRPYPSYYSVSLKLAHPPRAIPFGGKGGKMKSSERLKTISVFKARKGEHEVRGKCLRGVEIAYTKHTNSTSEGESKDESNSNEQFKVEGAGKWVQEEGGRPEPDILFDSTNNSTNNSTIDKDWEGGVTNFILLKRHCMKKQTDILCGIGIQVRDEWRLCGYYRDSEDRDCAEKDYKDFHYNGGPESHHEVTQMYESHKAAESSDALWGMGFGRLRHVDIWRGGALDSITVHLGDRDDWCTKEEPEEDKKKKTGENVVVGS